MKGHHADVLDHAPGCDGQEYSTLRPVVVPETGEPPYVIEVVAMQWCGDCMATFYEIV